jgi:predicted Fe-Mo cluster-binding NifX family protein
MRIAIPVWQEKVSPVLDTALTLRVVDRKGKVCTSCFDTRLDEHEIYKRCVRIDRMNIDVVICGAVSRAMLEMLKASGIQIIYGISGPYEEVLDAYFEGSLFCPKFMMPGYDHGDLHG